MMQKKSMAKSSTKEERVDETTDQGQAPHHFGPCLEALEGEEVQARTDETRRTQTDHQTQARSMMARRRPRRTSSPDPQTHRQSSSSVELHPQGACSCASSRIYPTRRGDDSARLLQLRPMTRLGMAGEEEERTQQQQRAQVLQERADEEGDQGPAPQYQQVLTQAPSVPG